jgi:hypothetical protein
MDRTIRCTVCFWRGTEIGAFQAPQVTPTNIPPAEQAIQDIYEQEVRAHRMMGHPTHPACPACGHHTVSVERRSHRPAA